ncbi:MAG: hypothetical protein CMN84_10300 [Spongiibacteraceae bacterium]|jgi:alpha-1,3-rhamnosyltransferase|nr:hypothetical protein [Spongiibacteraceae bacterium]
MLNQAVIPFSDTTSNSQSIRADTLQPRVTYVISCHNHERYIESCVLSVLEQNYHNIELLCFDDGSRDRSASILRRLANDYGFFFKQTENRGFTATLNEALSLATGEFFCVLGSDDLALPGKTLRQASYLATHPESVGCTGAAQIIDENSHLVDKQPPAAEADFGFSDFFTGRGLPFVASSAMYRTRALRMIGGYNESIRLEDLYLALKLTEQGDTLHNLSEPLVKFRSHRKNTSKKLAYMYNAILETLANYESHPDYRRVVSSYSKRFYRRAMRTGDSTLAQAAFRNIRKCDFDLKLLRRMLKHWIFAKSANNESGRDRTTNASNRRPQNSRL